MDGRPFTAEDAAMSANGAAADAVRAFRTLWDRCQEEIRREAQAGGFRMAYRVPEFHPDLPVYDVDVMASHVAEALEGIGYRAWIEGPGGLVGISWEHVRGRAARKLVLDGMAPAPEPATRRGRGRGRGQGQGRGRVRGRARGLVLEL